MKPLLTSSKATESSLFSTHNKRFNTEPGARRLEEVTANIHKLDVLNRTYPDVYSDIEKTSNALPVPKLQDVRVIDTVNPVHETATWVEPAADTTDLKEVVDTTESVLEAARRRVADATASTDNQQFKVSA